MRLLSFNGGRLGSGWFQFRRKELPVFPGNGFVA